MEIRSILAAAVLLGASAPVHGSEAQVFVPDGRWNANGDSGRCTLSRDFTDGQTKVSLSIEPTPFSNNLDLTLRFSGKATNYKRLKSRFLPDTDDKASERETESFTSQDGLFHVLRVNIERRDIDRVAASGVFDIVAEGQFSGHFQLPKLAAGLNVLDSCVQTISEGVGLSPVQLASIAQNAVAPPILVRLNYGEKKLFNNGDLEDEVIARYIVGPNGIATACGLVHAAIDKGLNQRVCILMHASPLRFTPAKDSAGRPVVGVVFERLRWFRM